MKKAHSRPRVVSGQEELEQYVMAEQRLRHVELAFVLYLSSGFYELEAKEALLSAAL